MWLQDTYLCCLYSCTSRRFVFLYSAEFKCWILASVPHTLKTLQITESLHEHLCSKIFVHHSHDPFFFFKKKDNAFKIRNANVSRRVHRMTTWYEYNEVKIHRSQIHLSSDVEEMKGRTKSPVDSAKYAISPFGTKIRQERIGAVPLLTMWMECFCRCVTFCDTQRILHTSLLP